MLSAKIFNITERFHFIDIKKRCFKKVKSDLNVGASLDIEI